MDYNQDIEDINDYNDLVAATVNCANVTPTTEQISQSLGDLMANHEITARRVPNYLRGCVDCIYAVGLQQLHDLTVHCNDCDPDLQRVIAAALDFIRDYMRERANKSETV